MRLQDTHENIYSSLLELVNEHRPIFTFNHISFDDTFYRVFFYNFSTYEKFCLPNALECRGITFEVTEQGDFIRLASLPMPKFFNYNENAFTQSIGEHQTKTVLFKEDGSLISSLQHNDSIHLKSKGHLFSEQAMAANDLLKTDPSLMQIIMDFEQKGYTVNLEYTAPDNQIVLVYPEPKLTILNIRNRDSGLYIPHELLEQNKDVAPYLVKQFSELRNKTLEEFSQDVRDMIDIEGFVALSSNGQWVKYKTDWYCIRHNTIDTFNPFSKKGKKRIIEAVINEETDDIRQILADNEFLLNVINNVEKFFANYLESAEEEVVSFIQEQQHIERKDFFKVAQDFFNNDAVKVKYSLQKRFSPERDSSLLTDIKMQIHASKFQAYNEFMTQIKNPNPDLYKE